jgi:hypothetical protein
MFVYSTASRPAPASTQPPIHWVPRVLFRGTKWPGCEPDHSPPSSTKVKNGGFISLLFHASSWRGAELFKQRATLTLYYIRLASVLQTH